MPPSDATEKMKFIFTYGSKEWVHNGRGKTAAGRQKTNRSRLAGMQETEKGNWNELEVRQSYKLSKPVLSDFLQQGSLP